jgi:hypothetical protein
MGIRCVFLASHERRFCQVLEMLGAPPVPGTQKRLHERFCTSGAFIACPVFRRVEEALRQANQLRGGRDPHRRSVAGSVTAACG